MSDKEIWNSFLENIKNEITNVSFDTWFNEEDTKFYSYKEKPYHDITFEKAINVIDGSKNKKPSIKKKKITKSRKTVSKSS